MGLQPYCVTKVSILELGTGQHSERKAPPTTLPSGQRKWGPLPPFFTVCSAELSMNTCSLRDLGRAQNYSPVECETCFRVVSLRYNIWDFCSKDASHLCVPVFCLLRRGSTCLRTSLNRTCLANDRFYTHCVTASHKGTIFPRLFGFPFSEMDIII